MNTRSASTQPARTALASCLATAESASNQPLWWGTSPGIATSGPGTLLRGSAIVVESPGPVTRYHHATPQSTTTFRPSSRVHTGSFSAPFCYSNKKRPPVAGRPLWFVPWLRPGLLRPNPLLGEGQPSPFMWRDAWSSAPSHSGIASATDLRPQRGSPDTSSPGCPTSWMGDGPMPNVGPDERCLLGTCRACCSPLLRPPPKRRFTREER